MKPIDSDLEITISHEGLQWTSSWSWSIFLISATGPRHPEAFMAKCTLQWRVINFTLWIVINFCTRCSTPIALQQLAFLCERRPSIHQEERLPYSSCEKQAHHAMHLRNLGSHSFTLTSRPQPLPLLCCAKKILCWLILPPIP